MTAWPNPLAESAIATGLSTFAGALVITTTPTGKDVVAAAVAAGISVLYVFAKGLGGTAGPLGVRSK